MAFVLRAARELQRHFANLRNANHGQYSGDLKILHAFLLSTPVFRGIIEQLKASFPDFDPGDWITNHVVQARKGRHSWPDDEKKMLVLLRAVERMVDGFDDPVSWGQRLTFRSNFDEGVARVTEEVVLPFVNYLLAQLGTESEMLHHLGRFKRQVEWFEQQHLFEQYESNTKKGEAVYDAALRRFLFNQGIDYPFSQPASASGKADVIAGVESDDPLVCELKLFDGENYGVSYLARGLNQAVRYAHDYGKAVGHLVVVNLSDQKLVPPTDGDEGASPPRVLTRGVTVFMIVVQGKPLPSASKESKPRVLVVSKDQLLSSPEAGGDSNPGSTGT